MTRKALIALALFAVATSLAAVQGSSPSPTPSPRSTELGGERDELVARIPSLLTLAAAQYQTLLDNLKGDPNLPRTVIDGKVRTVDPKDWTSGFFAGTLWLLFEQTGDAKWKAAARDYTARLEPVKDFRGSHDLGFMLYSSFGNGYRLTHDPHYRDVMLQGAETLALRFKPEVGLIRSWDNARWTYPVIIDNMMNLEFLMWASREGSKPQLKEIALSHADKTMREHFRPDGSTFHVVDYNPANGEVIAKQTAQGAADSSAWARGQAWALYGYTMMYRETRRAEYLDTAMKTARFLMAHPRMPEDKVPYWDFDAPDIPNTPRDASSAAIMASALQELAQYVEPNVGRSLRQYARQQLVSLSSPAYLAAAGDNCGFLLKHSVSHRPANVEVDVPLIYADYYFIEGLIRYRKSAGTSAGGRGVAPGR